MKKNGWHGGRSFEEVYLVINYGTKEIYALKKVKGYVNLVPVVSFSNFC